MPTTRCCCKPQQCPFRVVPRYSRRFLVRQRAVLPHHVPQPQRADVPLLLYRLSVSFVFSFSLGGLDSNKPVSKKPRDPREGEAGTKEKRTYARGRRRDDDRAHSDSKERAAIKPSFAGSKFLKTLNHANQTIYNPYDGWRSPYRRNECFSAVKKEDRKSTRLNSSHG